MCREMHRSELLTNEISCQDSGYYQSEMSLYLFDDKLQRQLKYLRAFQFANVGAFFMSLQCICEFGRSLEYTIY